MIDLEDVQVALALLLQLPPAAAYALIATGSALENIFPPVPSDTFVVLGAVLTDRGALRPVPVLLSAWLANVAGAVGVYAMARRHGPALFSSSWGRRLLRPHQFDRLSGFYERHGLWAIFFSRFLPVLRVIVPTFAGFTGLGFWRTVLPMTAASLIWNGLMLGAGIFASQNIGKILEILGRANAWLLLLAGLIVGGMIYWWIRSRREDDPEGESERAEGEPAPDAEGAGDPESAPRGDG